MRHAPPAEGHWWSGRQWLLAAVLASAGGTAWWLLRTTGQETPQGPRARLPDYVVEDFSAVETSPAGMPSRRLSAQELRHYAREDVSELDEPRLELYESDGPPWHARAESGTVFADGDRVRLSGSVQLDRAGDAASRPAHLETEQMDIFRAQGLAETDLPVRIRSDGDTLTANGMRLWYNDPTHSTFHGRAHIRLEPEKETQP